MNRIECIEKIEALNIELDMLNKSNVKSVWIASRINEVTDDIDRLSVMLEGFNRQMLMSSTGYSGYGLV